MATTAMLDLAPSGHPSSPSRLRDALRLIACAGLPLGIFGLVNLGAEALGILPLFFSPGGLPGQTGAIIHLVQLAFLGAAWWAMGPTSGRNAARYWLAGMIAAYIALPFVTPPLDSLQLSLLCTGLFLFALATLSRVGAVSPLAGWLMTPMIGVVGISATLGLVVTAAYTPPFALVQNAQPQPPA